MNAYGRPVDAPPTMRSRQWLRVSLLALTLSASGSPALSQTGAAGPTAPEKAQNPAPSHQHPAWNTLSASQQAALRPLAPIWNDISSNRKRKWIALSANYARLTPAEQATMHGRMAEWASLSAVDRNRARLNFAETRALSSEEKKAQWQAYQALSPAQKQQLAAQAASSRSSGAAPAITQRTPGKLASVPITRSAAGSASDQRTSKPAVRPAAGSSAAVP